MGDRIAVYGTQWCYDTVRARKCLERLGIDYLWIDINEDEEGSDFVKNVNKGNRSVPTIVFPDGSILVEPSDEDLEDKCRRRCLNRLSTNADFIFLLLSPDFFYNFSIPRALHLVSTEKVGLVR